MAKMNGSQAVVKCLLEEEVSTIFGYPGGAVLDLYDALMDAPIRNVLVRHEQGAIHAADGYARSTGKIGVALLTSGPGATNGVTGIATAHADSIPLVVITGQVSRNLIGNDAFQEVDIVGITRPCTKHNYLVTRRDDLVPILREAFHIAASGRPGPVLVDIPKDLQTAILNYPERTPVEMKSYQPHYEPHRGQIAKACKQILKAKRPILLAGGGVISSDASEDLTRLAERLNIPVAMTLMGLGAFPGMSQLSLGMLGMHGTYTANMAMANADVIVAVGTRFADRITGRLDAFAKGANIIHIDIDPTSISKNVRVDTPIVADCKMALTAMNAWLDQEDQNIDWRERSPSIKIWLEAIRQWQLSYPLTYKDDDTIIKPQYVVQVLEKLTGGNAIITTEVGQNQMWTAQFYRFNHPKHFVSSGGLGTMGFGLPAAIGAQIANPDKLVIDVAGDGSIQMNIQELATAQQQGCRVKVAILNNRYLGMVRQWQELFYNRRYSSTPMEVAPDFVQLAKAYGAVGLRATKKSEVEPVIKEALATDNLVLMDFVVDREEGVYPMIPAGKSTTEMLLV